MRLIGLLGGTSWPSTISYYERLNLMAAERSGGFNSARILLYSINYHEIKSNYGAGWAKVPKLLEAELEFFAGKKPECLVICNNTLHKAFDEIEAGLGLGIPVFHAGRLAAARAVEAGFESVLLLGTKFTMEDGFFARYFEEAGVRVLLPSAAEMARVQEVQSLIAAGRSSAEFCDILEGLIEGYAGKVRAVCLACTELPLFVRKVSMEVINPSDLQCEAAFKFACE